MFRKIYRRFPILTWLIAQLLLFCVECAVKKVCGNIDLLSLIVAVEAVITLCISCVVSFKRSELWIYKAVRIACVIPIFALTCMLSGETIMDRIDGRDLYAEVEAMYDCLKEYEFEKMEIDPDHGAVILYPAGEGGEEVVVHYRDRGALKYLKRKIRDARSFENGILFAAGYSWDGDWYALYVSENPDDQWLGRMNAEQIVPGVYNVLVPWNDL